MGRRGWAGVAASLDILPSTPGWEGWDVTVNSMGGGKGVPVSFVACLAPGVWEGMQGVGVVAGCDRSLEVTEVCTPGRLAAK